MKDTLQANRLHENREQLLHINPNPVMFKQEYVTMN